MLARMVTVPRRKPYQISKLMSPSKPKLPVSAAINARKEQAAKACHTAKLYSDLDRAVENLSRLIESGKFFEPSPKKQSRKQTPAGELPVFVKKVGALTITSDEPFDYHRYGTFKEKIKAEGFPTQGQIRFIYTNTQGEITTRTVNLIGAYPKKSPEYPPRLLRVTQGGKDIQVDEHSGSHRSVKRKAYLRLNALAV